MNKQIYTCKSRYGDTRFLEETAKNEYVLTGNSDCTRSDHPTLPSFIDFDGGPYLSLDMNLKSYFNLDKNIKTIIPNKIGYIILTHEN